MTLALGIGANTAIFSIVNAVLLQPLPYPDASRLFVVYEQRAAPVLRARFSAENFLDVQREARSFDALGGYIGTGFTLSDRSEPEFVMGQMISAELLDALDVQPLVGRRFRPDENEGGRDQVMLLGYALWQRRYGGDPAIVGRAITANGKPYTVVGVMPANFEFPQKRYEVWVPFAFRNNAQGMVNRGTHYLQVTGRLRSGTSPEHRIQPLRQPSALMMAKPAIKVPASGPSAGTIASANGAGEAAARSPESRNRTAVQATR